MAKVKKCNKCNCIKTENEFYKNKTSTDGLNSWCIDCMKKYNRKYKEVNREKNREYHKEYSKNYYSKFKDTIKEKYKAKRNVYYAKNREKIRNITKAWFKNNPNYRNNYFKSRRKIDVSYRLNSNIKRGINRSLSNGKKGYGWEKMLGYTVRDLMVYLENLFQPGMTWKNYGEWHIDHIIPISLWEFDSYDDREFKQCWALCNLQPLWAEDNLRKSNKILKESEE